VERSQVGRPGGLLNGGAGQPRRRLRGSNRAGDRARRGFRSGS
jgi:hypothetical protein